jgi:hypothetical protein
VGPKLNHRVFKCDTGFAIYCTTTTTVYAFSCPTLSPKARRLWSIRSRLSSPASVVHSYTDAGALGCRAARRSGCVKNSYRRFLQCSQGVPRRVLQSADSLPQSLPDTQSSLQSIPTSGNRGRTSTRIPVVP